MPRIGDYPSSNALIQYLLNTQARLTETQIQLSTQKTSTTYAGIAQSSQRLVTLENQRDLLDQFVTKNEVMDMRLKSTETVLGGINDTLKDFNDALIAFQSGDMTDEDRVKDMQETAFRALQDLSVNLNTDIDGRFIFAGGRVTTQPVDFGLTTLTAFQSKYDGSSVIYPQTRAAHVESNFSFDSTVTGGLTLASGPPATITAGTAGSLASIAVGSTITIGGSPSSGNNTEYTVVSNDGTVIEVSGDITVGATTTTITNSFAADEAAPSATISSSSYYSGDTQTQTHRVAVNRSFESTINAIDPAFEKAIRGIAIIAQGVFGTDGGLDAHPERIDQAYYLINAAKSTPPTGTAPFGTELTNSVDQMEQDVGFQRILVDQTNTRHEELMSFFDQRVSEIEDIDQLETITHLLEDEQALEASYQAFARIRKLSLTNFM